MSWLKVGIVGRSRGLRGAFYVSGRADALPLEYDLLLIGASPESARKTKIISSSLFSGRPLISVDEIQSKEQAEEINGLAIWVNESKICVDEQTEYLWDDIINRDVYDVDSRLMGKVTHIYNAGASDVITLENEDKILELPLVKGYFDMSFKQGEKELKLLVSSDDFGDLWSVKKTKG